MGRPQPVQQGGCSGSATCASACLQNQNWYGTWYYPTPKPEEAEEDSTTKPNYNQNQFAGCQYSDCAYNAGYYGSSCGLRPMLNYGNSPCEATKSGATFPIATAICALQIAKVTVKMADTAIQENVLVSKEFSKTTMLLTMTILLLLLLHKKEGQ